MRNFRPLIAFVAAAACAFPAAAASDPDPSVNTELTKVCLWKFTCGGVSARVKWSPDGLSCFGNAVPEMPFTVILRGNDFDKNEYNYLQDHLAQNGIASAALSVLPPNVNVSDYQGAADDAEAFLDSQCFIDEWIDRFTIGNPVDFSQTAIIGHSRGGEAARYLADNLVYHPEIDVRAVVALAPTHSTDKELYGTRSAGYLLLYGTDDPDTAPESVFPAHDSTGWNEISTPTASDLDRGMKLIKLATHKGFLDSGGAAQRAATQGYVNAFLRAWLKDDWQFYEDYIRGDAKPASYPSDIRSQFSSRTARRVIDNFENANTNLSTMNAGVGSLYMTVFSEVDATTLDTPHVGNVLKMQPSANNAYATWAIPVGQRDFSDRSVLSLRIGQITGTGPITARIGLWDGSDLHWLDLGAYGGVPEPLDLCVAGGNFCTVWNVYGTLRTIRIPLADFGAGNYDDVLTVYLQFQSGAIGDQIAVDNLELAD